MVFVQCVCVHVHVFQLMEGRKAVGGKLEVKIRIRDPYVTKQVDEVKEKWLVIDHFERRLPPAAPAQVYMQTSSSLIDSLLQGLLCDERFLCTSLKDLIPLSFRSLSNISQLGCCARRKFGFKICIFMSFILEYNARALT